MKFINKSLVFLVLIGSSHAIFPMQTAIKWLPKISSGLAAFGTLFPAGMDTVFAMKGENQKQKNDSVKLSDMPPKTSELIYGLARECGIAENDLKLKIVPGAWDWSAFGSKFILGSQEKIDQIEKDLAEGKSIKNSIAIMDATTAIRHELGHILHNDNELKEKMPLGYALGAYVGVNSVLWGIQKALNIKSPTSFLGAAGSAAFNIGVLAPLYWNMMGELKAAHSRFIESRADQFAFDHAKSREELEHTVNFYKRLHENAKDAFNNPEKYKLYQRRRLAWRYSLMKRLHDLVGSKKPMGDWLEQYPLLFQFVDDARDADHPIAYNRMKAAERALKKFEETKV